MSTSGTELSRARVLLIGAGGIGAPAAWGLAAAGVGTLVVADDDAIELSNLHRQILFEETDVGRPKLDALRDALGRRAPGLRVELRPTRATPATVEALLAEADVVLDGSDNFATRFLVADACALAGKPVVHAAAVRWRGTCFVGGPAGRRPCYRCLFEDLPDGPAPDCAGAGVVGPVCGVMAGVAVDAVIRVLASDAAVHARVVSFDGLTGRLRQAPVRARPGCPLCGASPSIRSLNVGRYAGPACAADT